MDDPPIRDLSKSPRDKFADLFNKNLEEIMENKQKEVQKITQMKFHDFNYKQYVKSNIKVKIDSHEKFSRKELEQKELILKGLTEKLQERLTTYEKGNKNQNSLLKEEEQKKVISQELNQIVSKNYKKESENFIQILSDKMNMNIVPAITTINQILATDIVDENKKAHLENIKSNLLEFLDDASRISEYQRLAEGDQAIHKTVVNVHEFIEKIVSKQKLLSNKKEVIITIENYDVETIFCDEYRISFVLNNLIRNSINSCEKNKEIKIIFNSNEKGATISVVDNGRGFTPEFLDEILSSSKKIIDPFAKENEIKANMIISRIIINNHKGEFNAISQPGQNTEISFDLPAPLSFSTKKN